MKNNWTFSPKNDWVYIKIYCGQLSVDTILNSKIYPLLKRFKKDLFCWFFLKYHDPDHHIRVRFKLKDNTKQSELVAVLVNNLQELIQNYRVWKIEFDLYKPEIRRYQLLPMVESEKLFQLDSEAYLNSIHALVLEQERVLYNLRSSFLFISHCYDRLAGLDFASTMETQYKKEFKLTKKGNQQLGAKYRSLKSTIESLLDGLQTVNLPTYLPKKERILHTVLAKVKSSSSREKFSFVSSHIHLNTNRTFNNNPRLYEMITYDFLVRYSRSLPFRT